MRSRRNFLCILALSLFLFAQGSAPHNQTASQNAPSSGSSDKGQSSQAKDKDKDKNCTDNGTYVNSKGETVKRPETCSSAPKGATAQCRDKSYSFSHTRQGTCSHRGGVAKWL